MKHWLSSENNFWFGVLRKKQCCFNLCVADVARTDDDDDDDDDNGDEDSTENNNSIDEITRLNYDN